MHFNAGNFRSAKFHHVIDMVDVIIFDDRENATHAADDSTLFTVMDVATANDVASDMLFQPSVVLAAAYCIALHLRWTFYMFVCKVMFIVRIQIFSKRDAGTFAVADLTVFNDPAFGPVGADHAVLVCSRRRPCCCRFTNVKSTDCNIVDAGFRWQKAFTPHVDLNAFFIWVFIMKICIDHSGMVVLLSIPFIYGSFRFPGTFIDFSPNAVFQSIGFIHHFIV